MKKIIYLSLIVLNLTLNGFGDFHEPFVRLFASTRARIYQEVYEGKITSREQLDASLKDFKDRKLKIPLKDIEHDIFVANILGHMFQARLYLRDFDKEALIEKLKEHMQRAINAGSEFALSDACKINRNTSLAVCLKAMQLMLSNNIQDCVILRRVCEQAFEGKNYKDILKDIFARDVDIPDVYPEADRGIFIPSPEKLEFTKDTINRLVKFLESHVEKSNPFYETIKTALESWRNQCES